MNSPSTLNTSDIQFINSILSNSVTTKKYCAVKKACTGLAYDGSVTRTICSLKELKQYVQIMKNAEMGSEYIRLYGGLLTLESDTKNPSKAFLKLKKASLREFHNKYHNSVAMKEKLKNPNVILKK